MAYIGANSPYNVLPYKKYLPIFLQCIFGTNSPNLIPANISGYMVLHCYPSNFIQHILFFFISTIFLLPIYMYIL